MQHCRGIVGRKPPVKKTVRARTRNHIIVRQEQEPTRVPHTKNTNLTYRGLPILRFQCIKNKVMVSAKLPPNPAWLTSLGKDWSQSRPDDHVALQVSLPFSTRASQRPSQGLQWPKASWPGNLCCSAWASQGDGCRRMQGYAILGSHSPPRPRLSACHKDRELGEP